MREIKEILKLKYQLDFSYRRIEKSIGVSRSSAAEYCRRFGTISNTLNEFLQLSEDEMYKLLYPEHKVIKAKQTRPKPDVKHIDKELKKSGVTYLLLWQEYKSSHPDGYGYTQFKSYHHKYKKSLNPSIRQLHLNGEKLFVDYSGMQCRYMIVKVVKLQKHRYL